MYCFLRDTWSDLQYNLYIENNYRYKNNWYNCIKKINFKQQERGLGIQMVQWKQLPVEPLLPSLLSGQAPWSEAMEDQAQNTGYTWNIALGTCLWGRQLRGGDAQRVGGRNRDSDLNEWVRRKIQTVDVIQNRILDCYIWTKFSWPGWPPEFTSSPLVGVGKSYSLSFNTPLFAYIFKVGIDRLPALY